MKIRKALAGIAALALAGGALFASATAASATYETPPEECVPTETIPGYWEDVPDIVHPAKYETVVVTPATEGTPAIWANFSPNDKHATFIGPPSYPTDERGTWHDHGQLPPGQAGPDGVYANGNPDKGGNWFYRQAAVPGTPEVTEERLVKEEWTEITPDIWHEEIPGKTCPPEEPGAANPAADLKAVCGEATLTLTNDGEDILTASFVVNVNGEFHGAYAVEAGESEDVPFTFEEDTGDYLIEVYQAGTSEWKLIESGTVPSDCIAPQPEDKVTEGQWSEPVITCDNEVGDEIKITRYDTVTPYVLVEGQWVLDEEAAETVAVNDVYVVTEADIEALDCAVEETPKPTPSPTVTPTPSPTVTPTPTVTPVLTGTGGDDGLAETGGAPLNPWVPTIGALAVATGIALAFLAPILHRRRTVKIEE